MPRGPRRFEPGSLRELLVRRTERAVRAGSLRTIPTDFEPVEQGGVQFIVRMFANLERKEEAAEERSREARNPFLPYEEDLFVAQASDTHLCLLNKFNVVDLHLLIVTREFEDQEILLTAADFEALLACMAEYDGLGFYNGGKVAGASQAHKHLQLVPLPLADQGPAVPIEPALPRLPFVNAAAPVEPEWLRTPREGGRRAEETYRALLEEVGIRPVPGGGGERQSGPYNLLVTRRWMLMVPRSAEFFESMSVNALGFAGALLVRDAREMAKLKAVGPMDVLKGVAVAR